MAPSDCGERGSHPRELGAFAHHSTNLGGGRGNATRHFGQGVGFAIGIGFGINGRERRDGRGAGQFTRRMSPHPVGNDEHGRTGVSGVFVARANKPDMRSGCISQGEGHRRSSIVLRPTLRGTLLGNTVGAVIRVLSNHVPFVLPRSSTIHLPSCWYSRA